MDLIKGKFYEGGKLVPLEFGNKKQIDVMNRALRQYNALTGEGLQVDIDYQITVTASIDFKCICGQTVWKEHEVDEEGDTAGMDGVCQCVKCKQRYIADFDIDGELIVKLLKEP